MSVPPGAHICQSETLSWGGGFWEVVTMLWLFCEIGLSSGLSAPQVLPMT